jgi:hypothetical protein
MYEEHPNVSRFSILIVVVVRTQSAFRDVKLT